MKAAIILYLAMWAAIHAGYATSAVILGVAVVACLLWVGGGS